MVKASESLFDFDFIKYFSDMKVPGVDMEVVVSSQRRNLEALTEANKLAMDGMQSIIKRQAELLRQSMEEAARAAQDIASADTPQSKMSRQTEIAKETMEKAVANMRELSEMLSKANTEIFDLLNTRLAQALEETRDLMARQQAQAGGASAAPAPGAKKTGGAKAAAPSAPAEG